MHSIANTGYNALDYDYWLFPFQSLLLACEIVKFIHYAASIKHFMYIEVFQELKLKHLKNGWNTTSIARYRKLHVICENKNLWLLWQHRTFTHISRLLLPLHIMSCKFADMKIVLNIRLIFFLWNSSLCIGLLRWLWLTSMFADFYFIYLRNMRIMNFIINLIRVKL